MNQYMKPGCLLDVGAAAGFVMKGFVELGWCAVGIEPNSGMADHARNCLGLDVETCTLEDFEATDRFDLVSMIQVVPHFMDPRRALRSAAQMTKPGGFWLIETWDRRSHAARSMGDAWHEYSPPSVLHWFSKDGLTKLVSEFGFSEVARGRPRKWIRASHAKAVARGASRASALSRILSIVVATIPDHLTVPYLGDDVYWVLYERPEKGRSQLRPIRGWA
jgi:SAM-dependent methyltransferase